MEEVEFGSTMVNSQVLFARGDHSAVRLVGSIAPYSTGLPIALRKTGPKMVYGDAFWTKATRMTRFARELF